MQWEIVFGILAVIHFHASSSTLVVVNFAR